MKEGFRTAQISRFFLLALILLPLASCAPPVSNQDGGNLTIILHGGERAAIGPIYDSLAYRLSFSGPGGGELTVTTDPGEGSVSLNLALGDWKVRADALLEDGALFGSGKTGVRIHGGRTNYVTITMTSFYLTDLGDFAAYLAAATARNGGMEPVPIAVMLELTDSNWEGLLERIDDVPRVALDLSRCTMPDSMNGALPGTFDPDNTNNSTISGKGKIVSLVLPDTAESIADGASFANPTFEHFDALESVVGKAVATVGKNAFASCTELSSVRFPEADTIDNNAFYGTGLSSLGPESLPKATTIGNGAFFECDGLTSVNLPEATTIGNGAFQDCRNLPLVNLPKAIGIGDVAFSGCTSLSSVSLPKATSIGREAFANTGTTKNLTVTLGDTPLELGEGMFYGVSGSKTVTVKVPAGASAWSGIISGSPYSGTETSGGPHWGEGFRGKGWNGIDDYLYGSVNTNISLTIQPLP
ncbi:MAG: leucine-rich repeat domain-containing protein [Spirochaetaceae bacterium]|jgi:hypothetical protein|nr:leucine-rich repeat domain-containing protein [Spirochaetaceae bacterium]